MAAGLGVGGRIWLEARAVTQYIDSHILLPPDTPPDLLHRWFDLTPVAVTYTAAWEKFTVVVPRYQFHTDPTLWARMQLEDWDALPPDERQVPLHAMLERSGAVIHAGDCWPLMTAYNWDIVPQPIRAIAILGVLEYWTRYYGVGSAYDLDIAAMVRTVQAIVMSESWFQHRSVLTNGDGTRDLGLVGASAYARDVIRKRAAAGRIDFSFDDEQYFNPWHAGRFVAFWFNLMLDEADGDVEVAIRAYNQGIWRATHGEGDDYLAAVLRRRWQFMGEEARSPTWNAILAWRAAGPREPQPRCHRGSDEPRRNRLSSSSWPSRGRNGRHASGRSVRRACRRTRTPRACCSSR